jgi:hypothetical protein
MSVCEVCLDERPKIDEVDYQDIGGHPANIFIGHKSCARGTTHSKISDLEGDLEALSTEIDHLEERARLLEKDKLRAQAELEELRGGGG